jgi:hypothetical protein
MHARGKRNMGIFHIEQPHLLKLQLLSHRIKDKRNRIIQQHFERIVMLSAGEK